MKDVSSLDDSVILERVDAYQQLPAAERAAEKARLLREFPHLAEDLAACLDGLDLVGGVASNLAQDAGRVPADGKTVATGSHDTTVRAWNTVDGSLKFQYRAHTRFVSNLAYSPDGAKLVSGGRDGTLRIWNPHTLQERNTAAIPRRADPHLFAFLPGEDRVVRVQQSGGEIEFSYEGPCDGSLRGLVYCCSDEGLRMLCTSDSGQYIAVGNAAGDLVAYDTRAQRVTR